jgi:hypothetical protein
MKAPATRMELYTWVLWSTSQYCVLILLSDFQTKYAYIVIFMMLGYIAGITILGFVKKITDEKIIKSGFIITILSFCFFFIVNYLFDHILFSLSFSYFFYTLSNAFLSASMLSLVSKERALDQQGKGFGLIISADSFGFLAATFAVLIFNSLKLKVEHMIIFSFASFLVSWFPYKKYKELRVNASRD